MSDDKRGVDLAATRAGETAEGFPAETLPEERTGGTLRAAGTRTQPPHRETFKAACDASDGPRERLRGAA